MKKYDVAVVLAHGTPESDRSNTLTRDCEHRVMIGAELLSESAERLMMCGRGCFSERAYMYSENRTHAQMMKDSALELGYDGVKEEDIDLQEFSVDTVGEAVFSFLLSDDENLRNSGNVAFVTSDYHIDRAGKIVRGIWHPDYSIEMISVPSALLARGPRIEAFERGVLEGENWVAFQRTFRGVKAGDKEAILDALFRKHHRYVTLEKESIADGQGSMHQRFLEEFV